MLYMYLYELETEYIILVFYLYTPYCTWAAIKCPTEQKDSVNKCRLSWNVKFLGSFQLFSEEVLKPELYLSTSLCSYNLPLLLPLPVARREALVITLISGGAAGSWPLDRRTDRQYSVDCAAARTSLATWSPPRHSRRSRSKTTRKVRPLFFRSILY